MKKAPESLSILFIGNSFAVDTTEHAADIAQSLGVKKVQLGTLFHGGCSIQKHYEHACGDIPAYSYYTNSGSGWDCTPEFRISDAIRSERWDWIVIQHGTKDGSRYTSPESYTKLDALIDYVKARCPAETKIAFNMTWLGEPASTHHEIVSYGGDMATMRRKLIEVTKSVVYSKAQIDRIIPTGTAIENARTSHIGVLTRDLYHLSLDKGRFIAALTLICSLAELEPADIQWVPEGVDDYALQVAIESVHNALATPLETTPSSL